MIDTTFLEAWCHNTESEALDWISQDRKMMAAEIRQVLEELKFAREVVTAAKDFSEAWGYGKDVVRTRTALNFWIGKYDEARQG